MGGTMHGDTGLDGLRSKENGGEMGETSSTGEVHLRGGGKSRVKNKQRKKDRRERAAGQLADKIKRLGEKLKSQKFLKAASANDVKGLEDKIARRVKILQALDSKNGLEASRVGETSQDSRADDSETEDEDQAVAHVQLKKRKASKSSFDNEDENENEELMNEITDANKAIVNTETTGKKEKKSKKHKKRKIDKSSQNSSQPLDSIPAFEQLEEEHGVNSDNGNIKSKKTIFHSSNNGENIPQNGSSAPSPEKTRQEALLDTITRSRARSESTGDGIYEALVAGMLAQPSPPSPMSPIADYPRSLIDIGRSALAAPILPNTQKPIRDRAFTAQVPVPAPAPAPKRDTSSAHRESPILPPVRTFSSSRIVPLPKHNGVEKSKSKKKDTHGKEANHSKSTSNTNREPAVEASQESITLSQTVTALKEAASATVIEGIFTQADPFTGTKKILPPAKTYVPAVASFPNSINSSTPDVTPTKPKSKSKSRQERRIEGEAEDWEKASGRFRARIDKDGSVDDGEVEENIAFSSTYLQARPLGISICGTKFQVVNIVSGTEQELPISTDKDAIKICSIAKGRVKVSLGSKSFSIGEGGMWRVRGGEKCVVANQLSSQGIASVHVCIVDG